MNKFIISFIPARHTLDEETFRKARLFVLTSFITGLFSSFYLITTIIHGMKYSMIAMLFNAVGFMFLPFLVKHKVLSINKAANIYILIGTIGVAIVTYHTGGLRSSVLPWFGVLPIASLMMTNKKTGWFWTIISYSSITVFGVLTIFDFPFENEINKTYEGIFDTTNLNGLVLLIFLIALVFENTKNTTLKNLDNKNKLLDKERKRSDELLLNILPAEVMEELKNTGKTRARHYDMVSVVFADFKDFTLVSEKLSPEELVSTIDRYYEMFDNIIAKHGAEKIKTVGDAYIFAVGIPQETQDNAVRSVELSMEILKVVEEFKKQSNIYTAFDIRIGIHTGPLVAGVVGVKKFAYDIWGDTVNTAARMQESGITNKINISSTTYELVKADFACSYRGKITAKHKGEIDMYFVDSRVGNDSRLR